VTKPDPIHSGLVEHAARILAHTPTRCLSAAALHERACRETGQHVPYSRFLAALPPRQFTVLEGIVGSAEAACWRVAERTAYAAVLGESGEPLIMLAAGAAEVHGGTGLPAQLEAACARPQRGSRRRPVSLPQPSLPDLISEAQDTLADLLRSSPEPSLRQAVGAAASELDALRRTLRPRSGS
jgi:hypothetical protein